MYRTAILPGIIALASILTLVACACGGPPRQAVVEDRNATAYATEEQEEAALEELEDPSGAFAIRIIYFAYDSSRIQPQFNEVIEAHADYLARNPEARVFLEGHADERGSREYNLALGERRSLRVKQQMVLLGAGASQIRTSSYGEERPADGDHNERAWAKNRRVEILYN